jgi:hypothetical protein
VDGGMWMSPMASGWLQTIGMKLAQIRFSKFGEFGQSHHSLTCDGASGCSADQMPHLSAELERPEQ